jgi:hypothetical protein
MSEQKRRVAEFRVAQIDYRTDELEVIYALGGALASDSFLRRLRQWAIQEVPCRLIARLTINDPAT